jgi:hypothetical protein
MFTPRAVRISAGLLAAVMLGVLSAPSVAVANPTLSVGSTDALPGQVVDVPVTFAAGGSVTAVMFEIVFTPAELVAGVPARGAAIAATNHELDSNLVAAGRLRILLLSPTNALLPSGVIVSVPMTVQAAAGAGPKAIAVETLEMVSASPGLVTPTAVTGGIITVTGSCAPGDIHPTGVGDGQVTLQDYVVGRRKLLGLVAAHPRDVTCGDLSPGVVTCDMPTGRDNWCPQGNLTFQLSDVIVLRRLLVQVYQFSCAECAPQVALAPPLRPADVAPRGRPDGAATVADVVMLLRMAVGLERPAGEELVRADVAPAARDGALTAVGGNGVVDVADVVLALRAAVGLDLLAWPERRLAVVLGAPVEQVALSAVVTGWPAWAEVTGAEGAGCSADGGDAGLDLAGDRVALTCVTDPSVSAGAGEVAVLTYRAPRAPDPATLSVSVDVVTPSLDLVRAAATLGAR